MSALAVRHPLHDVRTLLEGLARAEDADRLALCLEGEALPALGGNPHPAETLHRALAVPPYDLVLVGTLAGLAASLCARRARALEEELAPEALEDETYVFNLLLFASDLPRNDDLFAALADFHDVYRRTRAGAVGGRVARQLRQALVYHQVDDRLESYWLGLLRAPARRDAPLDEEGMAELLDAWTGLLWIPPSPEARRAGETVSVERIHRGLAALHDGAEGSSEGPEILRYALRQLNDAYPLSPELWEKKLSPHLAGWPESLRLLVADQWHQSDFGLSTEAAAIWRSLETKRRDELRDLAAEGEALPWRDLWERLFFRSPPAGLGRPQWVRALQEIKWALEESYCFPSSESEDESVEEIAGTEQEIPPGRRRKRKHRRQDRGAEYQRVSKVLREIDAQLVKGRLQKARKFLEGLVGEQQANETPPELIAKTLCNTAARAAAARQDDWAEELYRRAIDLDVDDPVPYTGLAELVRERRLDEAEALYRKTLERWPEDVVAHTSLAEMVKARRRLGEAEEHYRQVLEKRPEDVVARNGLAEVLKARGKHGESEMTYRRTIEEWPEDVVARNGLAELLKGRSRFHEAEALYRQTLEGWPDNAVARAGLGETVKAQGRLDEAEELYRQTLELWPDDVVVHTGLAGIVRARGRFDEAEELYRRILGLWPDNEVAHTGLAEVLKARGRYDEAEALYRAARENWPDNAVVHAGFAELLKTRGRIDEAEKLYREAVEKWPEDAVVHNGLAEAVKAGGRYDEAEELYRQAVERWPGNAVSRNGLANLLRKCKRFDEALALLPEPAVLASLQDHVDLHLRAMILLESGDLERGTSLLERGLASGTWPSQRSLYRATLIMADLHRERYDRARRELVSISETTPEIQTLRLHAAAGSGDTARALDLHSELTAKIQSFPVSVRELIEMIFIAWNLAQPERLRTPTRDRLDQIADAEIEMLLRAT